MSKAKIYDPQFSERMKFISETKFKGNNSLFAREVGVAVTSLNRWINGEADPSRSNLIKIAEVAEVSLSWLATGQSQINDVTSASKSQELSIDEALQALKKAISTLQQPNKDNSIAPLNNEEKQLIKWFRVCDKDKQEVIIKTTEVLARQVLNKQKESSEPLDDYKVA